MSINIERFLRDYNNDINWMNVFQIHKVSLDFIREFQDE